MRVGVIGPMSYEIEPLMEKLEEVEIVEKAMLDFYVGIYEKVSVVAVRSGICKVNAAIATQILIDEFEVDRIILTGVAGALNDRLHIGDTVIGTEIAHHDVDGMILTKYHPHMEEIFFRPDKDMIEDAIKVSKDLDLGNNIYKGRIITGETFITDKERDHLIEAFSPMCVDMESASVAHVCYTNDIPLVVIRSMSDSADEESEDSFEKNVIFAADRSLAITEGLIKKYGEKF